VRKCRARCRGRLKTPAGSAAGCHRTICDRFGYVADNLSRA
jgi:hypothetical protein